MTPDQLSVLSELKEKTIEGMVSFMKYGAAENENDPDYDPAYDAGYAQKHVDKCAKIIDVYLDALKRMAGPADSKMILNEAKKAVLNLNKLNEQCDGRLIETDQREQLCELIFTASRFAGLPPDGVDFTEEWREW